MKLKFEDMKAGQMYIDAQGHLCVKLYTQGGDKTYSAVLMYCDGHDDQKPPLSLLFGERKDVAFVIPNAFDIKRFFSED